MDIEFLLDDNEKFSNDELSVEVEHEFSISFSKDSVNAVLTYLEISLFTLYGI